MKSLVCAFVCALAVTACADEPATGGGFGATDGGMGGDGGAGGSTTGSVASSGAGGGSPHPCSDDTDCDTSACPMSACVDGNCRASSPLSQSCGTNAAGSPGTCTKDGDCHYFCHRDYDCDDGRPDTEDLCMGLVCVSIIPPKP